MRRYLTTTGLAAGLLLGGVASASAAILDFTVNGSILTGNYGNIGYTLTGVPIAPNQNQAFDGNAADVLAPLALENDGVGIDDDEVAFAQIVTITFDKAVTLRGVYFLDLFAARNGADQEAPIIAGGASYSLTALEPFNPGQVNTGYAKATLDTEITGTIFTFTANNTNDNQGDPDYALAGLDLAPIPLPAGVLLLGSALAGLGLGRRRKA